MTPYGPEPEYIAVDKEGKYAYVGLQEANGIAVLNLKTDSYEKIYSLGLKDFSLTGNEIDPHDQENGSGVPGRIELRPAAVKGLYQPDTIAAYSHKDRTYLVMANEGDSREDSADERRGPAGSGAAAGQLRVEDVGTQHGLGRFDTADVCAVSHGDADDDGELGDAERHQQHHGALGCAARLELVEDLPDEPPGHDG